MSKKQTIKFTINQDGTVKEEVVGSVATECESLTKIIEDKLGTVTQRLYKPEYYQTQTITTKEDVTLQHNSDQD
tara:strand:- start:294 stop:515 length:222 start_codon:yes stop_codon:yes gene_type:complete